MDIVAIQVILLLDSADIQVTLVLVVFQDIQDILVLVVLADIVV